MINGCILCLMLQRVHCAHWTSIMINGRLLCLLCSLCPSYLLCLLDETNQSATFNQLMSWGWVHCEHYDGHNGHPLCPLDMSIGHKKWTNCVHCVHWWPLDIFNNWGACPMDVQWTSNVNNGWTTMWTIWPMETMVNFNNSCEPFTKFFFDRSDENKISKISPNRI